MADDLTQDEQNLVSDLSQAHRHKSLLLHELAAKLGNVRSLPDISALLSDFVPRLVPCSFLAFYLCGEDGELVLEHISNARKKKSCAELADSKVSSWIFANRKPAVVPADFLPVSGKHDCIIAIPLMSAAKDVGLIYVFTDMDTNSISQHDMETLQTLASFAGITCENVRLYLRMEEQNSLLSRTKTYLANILDSMIHGVVVLDAAQKITLLSKSAEILLGVNAQDVIGAAYCEVFNPDLCRLLSGIIKDTIRTDYVFDKEFSCRMRGGSKIPLGISASKLKDDRDRFIGIIVILRDLSGAKRLATLSNLNRMKSEFVSTVAHEFKVPLNLVVSSANMLSNEMKGNLDATQLKLLDFILNGGTRLNTLINDLLELSRIETSSQFSRTEKIEIGALVAQVKAQLVPVAEGKDIEIIVESGEKIEFFGNMERLFQALHNLVHNAVKYTLPGGRVTVSWAPGEEESFIVRVEDTGIGIPEDESEVIFDEFVRLKDPRTDEEGTGLGLTIVKKIAELHRGSVAVAAAKPQGTVFTLELPTDFRKQQ